MIAIKKIAAIFLAVSVVASSMAIFAGVGPAVELLASFEKEYANQKIDIETMKRLDGGLDKAELDILKLAKKMDGQARK
ncbi:hypothetical protein [Sporosarcina koreensis]|uniref:hypothetical protein n=1 Tax=Bacillales TaxID=1385 RepID=UPI00075F297C|nr:hypothetical protein [Sporosarcina koreensis]